jgi:hypothetical protein
MSEMKSIEKSETKNGQTIRGGNYYFQRQLDYTVSDGIVVKVSEMPIRHQASEQDKVTR